MKRHNFEDTQPSVSIPRRRRNFLPNVWQESFDEIYLTAMKEVAASQCQAQWHYESSQECHRHGMVVQEKAMLDMLEVIRDSERHGVVVRTDYNLMYDEASLEESSLQSYLHFIFGFGGSYLKTEHKLEQKFHHALYKNQGRMYRIDIDDDARAGDQYATIDPKPIDSSPKETAAVERGQNHDSTTPTKTIVARADVLN